MISLYSGTPGSGKSLHASQVVRNHLKFYSDVIGTFHINEKRLFKNSKFKYTYVNIYSLTPDFLVSYAKLHRDKLRKHVEGSFLLVIDEAQRIFNSRTWNNEGRNEWITFFAEHRHLGFDIILIAQNDRMLDRQIRGLIEYDYIHRKVSQFGIKGKLLSVFTGQFAYVKNWYPLREKIDATFFRADKRLYDFYDSFEEFSSVEDKGNGVPLSDTEKYLERLSKIDKLPPTDNTLKFYQAYIDREFSA